MSRRSQSLALVIIGAAALSTLACTPPESGDRSSAVIATSDAPTSAASSGHAFFSTPEEAVTALVVALELDDSREELQHLLGPGTEELFSSGDAVADQAERDAFLGLYREGHELVAGSSRDLVLQVGSDGWPLPIPLVRDAAGWRFDGAAGAHELVVRRIGANELDTIDVMNGYVEAQEEYAATEHDGVPAGAYAQKIASDTGTQNGLYWEVVAGEPQSPLGPMLVAATEGGYVGDASAPYHGYLYRKLRSQGASADGGAREYVVDGKQTGGFALVAYPATYGASGIMTFIVNQDGVVWQKDLGEETSTLAAAMDTFDPDSRWTPIAPEQ